MVKIEGLYNTAFCYTPVLEDAARAQIQSVCDQKEFAGCKIRVMPDVHAGKGCTIGTTMTIRDKIVPGMVGVDIGCGMETVELAEREIDFERLDALIRKEIPYGREVRDEIHALNAELDLSQLCCADQVNLNRAMRSIGSLGGGNHFIEVDRAEDGRLFLVVHSGSRHLGTEVAEYYQNEGRRALWGGAQYQVQATIDHLKAEGRFQEIQKTIKALKKEHELNIPKDLAYVEGKLFEDYIHDMKLTQQFAMLNRKAMVDVIMTGMGFSAVEAFTTIHNYIDTDAMILRKGSVSAKAGEKLLIPINMRDGKATSDFLNREYPGNTFMTAHFDHSIATAIWRLDGQADNLLDTYHREIAAKGLQTEKMVPALRFSTSDVGMSGANLYPIFLVGAESRIVPLGYSIRTEHKNGVDII